MEILNQINRLLAIPLRLIIKIYQATFSPDHGLLKVFYPYGYCKFYPSCSEYAIQTLENRGLMGIPKIIKRLISCRPSSLGGVDMPIK